MDLGLSGKIALVTGASKGIGLACAQAFAAEGATVVGVSRSQKNLDEALKLLREQGLSMHTYAADLIDGASAAELVRRVEQEVGPIAILVNSAGAARRYPPEELDAAAFKQGMDAKYFSYVHVMQPVVHLMAARGAGSVVNIIGQGGRAANQFHIAGGAANSALMLSTVGMARAYAGKGVRVNAINPGLTRTGRVDEGLAASARSSGKSKEEI
ncbi:MAG: SDR family NAD(P)-dependent oxidoreductase, partial [Quisquiliibacterium sp.]